MTDSDSRKRRQHEDPHFGKKIKKFSPESTASSKGPIVKVSSVALSQASPPVIASSPGITILEEAQFNTYARQAAKRPGHGANDILLHSTSHRRLDYTARECKPKGSQPLLKYYIGIFDPTSVQLQLIEAKKMVIRGAIRAEQVSEEDIQTQRVSQTMADLKTELGQAFGTKKAKKALAAVTENAIAPRNTPGGGPRTLDASKQVLMASMNEVMMSVATAEDLQSAVDAAKPVPKGNYEADDIRAVYNPEDLIGRDILELVQVNDWVQSIKKNEEIQLRSRFVANRINRIGSGEGAVSRLRLLRYLYFLILLFLTSQRGKGKGTRQIAKKDTLKEELAPASSPVIESIRRKFSDDGFMHKQHVDLLMTHCCVFACILDNFDTNSWDLKEDLKLEQRPMDQYFREIGARIKKAKVEGRTDSIAQLKLPLQFPKMRRVRRR